MELTHEKNGIMINKVTISVIAVICLFILASFWVLC